MTAQPPCPDSLQPLLVHCRAGFEADVVEELRMQRGDGIEVLRAAADSGFAWLGIPAAGAAWRPLVFARAQVQTDRTWIDLPGNDRVTPIAARAAQWLGASAIDAIGEVWVEYPDTNEGKSLSRLARALEPRLAGALAEKGLRVEHGKPRLHVFLSPQRDALLGLQAITPGQWRNGIARLSMPRDAPSRSTLKLAEAIQVFLGDAAPRRLQPNMRAVDLGAAPGGWTWQLLHRGLHVTAVDNGSLKGELFDSALVRHLREDGFRFRPKKTVDWMVCDMVEKPSRIAALVSTWLAEGWCRASIFNLKLPMKKRVAEVARCRALIEDALRERALRHELAFRQLYHDREEVTGYCRIINPRS